MWHKLPVKDRMSLMQTYRDGGFSYRDAVKDYNDSYQKFGNGGATLPKKDKYGNPITISAEYSDTDRAYYDPRTNTAYLDKDVKNMDKDQFDRLIAHENRHAWQMDNDRSNFDITHNTEDADYARMLKKPSMVSTNEIWNKYYDRKDREVDLDIKNFVNNNKSFQFTPGNLIYDKAVDQQQYANPNSKEGEASLYEWTGKTPEQYKYGGIAKFGEGGTLDTAKDYYAKSDADYNKRNQMYNDSTALRKSSVDFNNDIKKYSNSNNELLYSDYQKAEQNMSNKFPIKAQERLVKETGKSMQPYYNSIGFDTYYNKIDPINFASHIDSGMYHKATQKVHPYIAPVINYVPAQQVEVHQPSLIPYQHTGPTKYQTQEHNTGTKHYFTKDQSGQTIPVTKSDYDRSKYAEVPYHRFGGIQKFDNGGVNNFEGDLISKVIMNRNRDKDFVQRAYAVGEHPNSNMFTRPDDNEFGQRNSHLMGWGEDDRGQAWMYPSVMNPGDEAIKVPNQYADYISSKGYKNATGIPTHRFGGMQRFEDGGEKIGVSPYQDEGSKMTAQQWNESNYEKSLAQAKKEIINDHVEKGFNNTVNNPAFKAVASLTPIGMGVGAIEGAANLVPDIYKGDYGKAGLDALQMAPIVGSNIKNAYKLNPLSVKLKNYNNIPSGSLNDLKKEYIPGWLLEEMRFKSLPELNNPEASRVLENFKTRIKTPEGVERLKQLGITNTKLLDNLKIVKDENTLGHYWHEKIGLNPYLPEVKNVTRHEIEHGVQNSIENSRMNKYNNDAGNFKYLFRPKAKKEAIATAMKQTSDIDDILGGLELRKTPEKVDWAKRRENKGKADPSRLFDYMSDKQRATNYFDSGSNGKEKSAFLGEVQQHMMDNGIIPSNSYTNITPEMVKETFIDAMFDEKTGGKYLRLFNIMKPTDYNYNLISKGLNKMLSIGTPSAIGAAALQQKNK